MQAESGPIGGDLSHEFIVLAETGESAVYLDRRLLETPVPGEDVDYEGDLSGRSSTGGQPLRRDRGCPRCRPLSSARLRRSTGSPPVASRSARPSSSATSTPSR